VREREIIYTEQEEHMKHKQQTKEWPGQHRYAANMEQMDGWTCIRHTVSYTAHLPSFPTAHITKELTFYFKTYRLGKRRGDLRMFQQSEEMWHVFPLPITLKNQDGSITPLLITAT
jgi:hypothetical protein